MVNFAHGGSLGDITYSVPTIISLLRQNNLEKANFYLKINEQAYYYGNVTHPSGDVRLSEKFANQLIPLLEYQPYINKAEIYKDQPIDVDLDEFRYLEINQSQGYIARWYFYAFLADYDLSKPWIFVEPLDYKDCILVNRTSRYRNFAIEYSFLNNYKNVMFLGLEQEWKEFSYFVPNSEFIICKDFLEMAKIIAGCKLFIGGQSFAYSLAEAIKVPRILEICPFANNIIPHGEKAYDFHTQAAFEKIVEVLSD